MIQVPKSSPKSHHHSRSKKKTHPVLTGVLVTIVAILALGLIFNRQLTDGAMQLLADRVATLPVNAHGIKPQYGTPNLNDVSAKDVAEAWQHLDELSQKGAIAVPSVGINLPIFAGVNSIHLMTGAAEQLPEATVHNGGPGNYILASHNMIYDHNLFEPVTRIQNGAQIYTTDGKNLYQYQVFRIKIAYHTDARLLNIDTKGAHWITLYTCTSREESPWRIIVQGRLVKKTAREHTTKAQLAVFAHHTNTYSPWVAKYMVNLGY